MTDVVSFGGVSTYIDARLQSNIRDMAADIRKDDDAVVIVDGKERIGKSVFAMQLGWLASGGNLSLDNICLTPKEFRDRVMNSKNYDVIIFDEAYLGLTGEDSMQRYNRLLRRMLATVGQMNLFIILVIPSVFDLKKSVVLHRSDALIHCFKFKGRRGHFAYYSHRKTQLLFINGKKTYSYFNPKCSFNGKFTAKYVLDEAAYRQKKRDALTELGQGDEKLGKMEARRHQWLVALFKYLKREDSDFTLHKYAEVLNCDNSTIAEWVNAEENGSD